MIAAFIDDSGSQALPTQAPGEIGVLQITNKELDSGMRLPDLPAP